MVEDTKNPTVVTPNQGDLDADTVGSKQLACAVIARAVEDLQSTATHDNAAKENERAEAIAFLTERTGPWAKARAFWASLAEVDPELLADRAELLLA